MAINPASLTGQSIGPAATGQLAGNKGPKDSKAFSKMLETYLGRVNEDQQAAATAMKDLVAGKTEDVLPVVTAMAKADLSFKLLMGVRNKVIEAYKQTMNMQI